MLRPAPSVLAGLALAVAGLAACSRSTPPGPGARAAAASTTTAAAAAGPADTVSTSTTATTAPASAGSPTTTSTTTPPESASGAAIQVSTPRRGAQVVSPFSVAGTSRAPGPVQVQLTDGSGNVLAQQTLSPGSAGAFSLTLRYAVDRPGPGTLILFTTSASGARQNLTEVPLQLGD